MGPRFKSVLGSQKYQRYPDKKLYRDFLFSVDLIHRDFPPCFSEILKDPLSSPIFCPYPIGSATSKTLAKVASRIAKKSIKANGVLDLTSTRYQGKALEITSIEDVWGVGGRYTRFLTK